MSPPRVLFVSDNYEWLEILGHFCTERCHDAKFTIATSARRMDNYEQFNMAEPHKEVFTSYDFIVSVHCQQIFPAELCNQVSCYNIHPGLLPWGRGYYPYIFAILEDMPPGACLHMMDEKIDHGMVIAQAAIMDKPWYTAKEVYQLVQQAEISLLETYWPMLLSGQPTFATPLRLPPEQTKLRTKAEFASTCKLSLSEDNMLLIRKLRALTFGDQANAYFHDKDGNKIKVGVFFEKVNDGEPE